MEKKTFPIKKNVGEERLPWGKAARTSRGGELSPKEGIFSSKKEKGRSGTGVPSQKKKKNPRRG